MIKKNQEDLDEQSLDLAELKKKSVKGGFVTIGAQLISIVVQLTSTVVLARLLSPSEYGIIGMVAVLISFAGLFKDMGLSAASIQKGSLSHEQMSNLFWLNVMAGTFLTALVAASSPLVAMFYGKQELLTLTILLSFNFILASFGTQHRALLQRKLQFQKRAAASIAGAVVTLAVSIILALKGWSYWSLAWGSLSGTVVSTIVLVTCSTFHPGRWTGFETIKPLLRFGANVTAFDFLNYFHRNADTILIGKFWGEDVLGLYSRAYQILMFPITSLRGPVSAVAFPVLSKLQNEPAAYRRYYRKMIYLLAMFSMPAIAFLFFSAEDFIEVVFGKKWLEAAPIFSYLAITAFIQPTASLRGMVLLSVGQSKRYLTWGIVNAVIVLIAFMIGVIFGAVGVAISYAVVNYLLLVPSLIYSFAKTPLNVSDFFGPVAVPAIASLLALAGCSLLFGFFGVLEVAVPWLRLLVASVVFGLMYLVFTLASPTGRKEFFRLPELLKSLKKA